MSHLVEIPDSLYAALKEAADASGLTPVDWIAAHLPQAQRETGTEAERAGSPKTLADLFAGRVGRIRSGGRGTAALAARMFVVPCSRVGRLARYSIDAEALRISWNHCAVLLQ